MPNNTEESSIENAEVNIQEVDNEYCRSKSFSYRKNSAFATFFLRADADLKRSFLQNIVRGVTIDKVPVQPSTDSELFGQTSVAHGGLISNSVTEAQWWDRAIPPVSQIICLRKSFRLATVDEVQAKWGLSAKSKPFVSGNVRAWSAFLGNHVHN